MTTKILNGSSALNIQFLILMRTPGRCYENLGSLGNMLKLTQSVRELIFLPKYF